MKDFNPREIISELDRYIIGQQEAKKSVAIALRNRWRRKQLEPQLREEVLPKNILMVGPTGCGKTEIARRIAKLSQSPFIKVEATKFTEVGYVGRDVEQIIRDLVNSAIKMEKDIQRRSIQSRAEVEAEKQVLEALIGKNPSQETLQTYKTKLRNGELDDKEIEIEVTDNTPPNMPTIDLPGGMASMGMISLGDIFGKGFGGKQKKKKFLIQDALKVLTEEEAEKLIDHETIQKNAIERVEQDGIVFIDEIDKITMRSDRRGGDVSREGVQRDLLPLIEGTTVSTKYGAVKTDHILFITSGAFHQSKPSDLLAELQGRLPIRVTLNALTEDDFIKILQETDYSLPKQYEALMATEGVTLKFSEDAIRAIAHYSAEINQTVENIGARRLHTLLEKVLEDISFTAPERSGEEIIITEEDVKQKIQSFFTVDDLDKFIL